MACDHFGCSEAGRTTWRYEIFFWVVEVTKAKICDFDCGSFVYEDVRGFEVSVGNVVFVQVLDS